MKKFASVFVILTICVSLAVPCFTVGIDETTANDNAISNNPVNDFPELVLV